MAVNTPGQRPEPKGRSEDRAQVDAFQNRGNESSAQASRRGRPARPTRECSEAGGAITPHPKQGRPHRWVRSQFHHGAHDGRALIMQLNVAPPKGELGEPRRVLATNAQPGVVLRTRPWPRSLGAGSVSRITWRGGLEDPTGGQRALFPGCVRPQEA